jgi:hypothetical protein
MPIENQIAMFLMVSADDWFGLGLKLNGYLFIIYLSAALLVIIIY